MKQMSQGQSGRDLVPLQVSDLVPANGLGDLGHESRFAPQLLRATFAQIDNAQRWQPSRDLGTHGFRDGNQSNFRTLPPGPKASRLDSFFHGLQSLRQDPLQL